LPQVIIGLAVTRDGIPVKHWVFSGNTMDMSTIEQVKKDLVSWHLSRVVFVVHPIFWTQKSCFLMYFHLRFVFFVPMVFEFDRRQIT